MVLAMWGPHVMSDVMIIKLPCTIYLARGVTPMHSDTTYPRIAWGLHAFSTVVPSACCASCSSHQSFLMTNQFLTLTVFSTPRFQSIQLMFFVATFPAEILFKRQRVSDTEPTPRQWWPSIGPSLAKYQKASYMAHKVYYDWQRRLRNFPCYF